MEITYYGHSCFGIDLGGFKILFDPFISPNELANEINVDEIECDFMLISHAHEDHIADAEAIAKRTGAKIISNWEIVQHFAKLGLENGHPMNIGGSWDFEFGTVKMVEAVHSSSFPDGSYGGNPAGFIIETADQKFLYAGDTALHWGMKMLGDMHRFNFAFLPIGDNFTMDVEDALIAAAYLNVDQVIGMHYQTFPYIEIDPLNAQLAAKREGIELKLMDIGGTLSM